LALAQGGYLRAHVCAWPVARSAPSRAASSVSSRSCSVCRSTSSVLFSLLSFGGRMADIMIQDRIAGFGAPVHRALTEPILPANAARAVAIPTAPSLPQSGLGFGCGLPGCCRRPAATWRPCGPRSAIRSLSRWCAGMYVIRIISNREARHDGPYRVP
jgi:hypothetical protein